MKKIGIVTNSISLDGILLGYATILHRTDDDRILLDDKKIFSSFDEFCSKNKMKVIPVTDKFLVQKPIHFGDSMLEPGEVLCRTDNDRIELQNGTIIYCSFYAFCLKKRRNGDFVADAFVVTDVIHLGDYTLQPKHILRRTANGLIMLENGEIVYGSFYNFCLQNRKNGYFI